MRRGFTRRWSTPPRDIESRANAAITIRRAAHCARHSRRADHEVARRARSVRRGCGRWPLAKAHDRGESNQHPALLERQDCTLVAWYRFLYAPRAGGRMTVTIGRRKLLAALGGAAAWPLAARAQQPAMPVVGFLRSTAVAGSEHLVAAFRRGLSEAGFVEGQNVAVEYRFADDQNDRLPGMAAEF